MSSVDLDAPEHEMCSHALARARDVLRQEQQALGSASRRADAAEARAREAEAEVTRLRAALERVSVDVGRVLYPEGGKVAPVKP